MFVTVIAASGGIHQLAMRYPQMKIITSEVDAGLNENNRVVPGVGEFGDRYFGTEEMRARFDLDEDAGDRVRVKTAAVPFFFSRARGGDTWRRRRRRP